MPKGKNNTYKFFEKPENRMQFYLTLGAVTIAVGLLVLSLAVTYGWPQ